MDLLVEVTTGVSKSTSISIARDARQVNRSRAVNWTRFSIGRQGLVIHGYSCLLHLLLREYPYCYRLCPVNSVL